MNITLLATISTILFLIAWRLWQERGAAASVWQGVLLAAVMIGWFLRIVIG